MDPTEDLSARVLLKNILSTEPPRTPITRSASKGQSTSGTPRNSRLSKRDAGAQTPQDILRRSLRQKMRESITRKSLPTTVRRTASVGMRKINTPASASVLFDSEDTPRHILRNILQTEPVKSPVVHEKVALEQEPQLPSANSGITSKRPSIELSGLDLPDLTVGIVASTAKGLSRKRPRRSLNVTAFEKRIKDGNDAEEETEESIGDHSSQSLSSSSSLSLKTPFVDVRTEKRGLQRRVSNRRKITEEEFGAAVIKRQMGGESSFVPVKRDPNETTSTEGFTLGLSRLSEPEITTDIVNCNTALYTQADAMTSNFSIVATQDKPTVMASQLQRQMTDAEDMEVEQSKLGKDKSVYMFPTDEEVEPQSEECIPGSELQKDVDAAECQKENRKSTADGQPEFQPCVMLDTAESEEEENRVKPQTKEEGAADPHNEGDDAGRSQSEEEEVTPDCQTEEEQEEVASSQTEEEQEEVASSQTEEEQEDAAGSQTEEEQEDAAGSQTEAEDREGTVASQSEEDVETSSQNEDEEVAPDSQTEEEQEDAAKSQTEEEEGAIDSDSEEDVEARSQTEEDGDTEEYESGPEDPAANLQSLTESQTEDKQERKQEEEEHMSRRAHRSEGGLIIPIREPGWSEGKSKAHSAMDLHSSFGMGSHESSQPFTGMPESSIQGQKDASRTESEPDADKENSSHLTHDIENSEASSEEVAAQLPTEQEEEEWEDEEESEEFPCQTPAFVREKRKFFQPDPLASPSVLKDIQTSASTTGEALPATKPKQVQQRKRAPAKKEAGLPKNYLMATFKHFAKMKVSTDVYPVLKEIMDKFFDRMADDLETYASHAKRKTIEVEDAELLLKRQGHVNDKVTVEVLIEKYLRMEQRKLLIPIATSGNVVIPKKRR